MTALQRLEAYLRGLDRRLRFFASARGLAALALCAFSLTVFFTWIANRYRFAENVVWPLRLLLFAGIATTLVLALILPLTRMNRRRTTRLAEAQFPEFGQRLLTISEKRDDRNPFMELIAEEALNIAAAHPPHSFAPTAWLAAALAAACAFAVALLWLITSAPGYWGYGAALLWAQSPRTLAPLYDIAVTPGDTTVRRSTDQKIGARLRGFSADNVVLHTKYKGTAKWERIPMQAEPSGNGYQLLFSGLSDSLEYYVEAGASRSRHFTLSVKDLPAIKRLRVAVHFPAEIHLPDAIQDPGGDIRAVEGSKAGVRILTDKPLRDGVLVMENGSRVPLVAGADQWLSATLPIKSDGSYHVAALDHGEEVRMTDNFIIEARKDDAPSVAIVKPGRDAGVSPIEELPVKVNSADDFGLRSVDLHYSINGGPEQVKAISTGHDAKQVDGESVLALEDYRLAPGDLVTMYATAKDATHTSRSDIVFAKVEPFDLKFQQSQQSGGAGGGGGQQQGEISARQKEIIAATWNQIKTPPKDASSKEQNARFLSDMEEKLSAQAAALAERMNNRQLDAESVQFQQFAKSMGEASNQLAATAKQLRSGEWAAALAPEQKGLQSILHAESIFRDIQVAFGKQPPGGGSGSGQDRDLARLFDLELDTAKNQYESGQSASSEQDKSQELDKQLERLKELARRQQQLASEQHSPQQQFQQRWEEEQLRREAEQLRQQLKQQMSANSQPQSGSPSSSGSEKESMRQAMDALSKAEDEIRNSGSQPGRAAQQRAANNIEQARQALQNLRQNQAGKSLDDLAEKAKQLSASQGDLAQRVKKLYGAEGINVARTNEDGSIAMPEMNGPGYAGGWSRRHLRPMPDHPATPDEKRLAAEDDKLAGQMEALQRQLHEQAQSLATQKPGATRQLRKALSDSEQDELAVRMRKGSEWLRDGYGSKTWAVQDSITAATERLSKQVDEARRAAGNAPSPGDSTEADGSSLGQALSQVRSLREQLQSGSGKAAERPADQLAGVRSQLGGESRELSGYFNDAMGSLRRFDAQQGLLDARLSNGALISLQRLELELARRMSQKAGARTGASENVPAGYGEAVATYFKSLSK